MMTNIINIKKITKHVKNCQFVARKEIMIRKCRRET